MPLRGGRARIAELGGAAVPPPEIMLIAEEQHRGRARWNKRHPGLNEVPPRWRPERAIDWVAAKPSLSSAERWLPAGLCFLGHERDRAAGLAPADSSGLAAGESAEDAAIRAFVELVQRDAVAIWWYHRIARPRLSAERVGDPLVADYARWSRDRERVLRLHDLTHDLGIPVVAAVSHHEEGGAIALGCGAAHSMAAAARQAVGELVQCECNLALIAARAARQGLNGVSPEAKALLEWTFNARLEEHPHLSGPPSRMSVLRPLSPASPSAMTYAAGTGCPCMS
jgi:thiazole/oxazole-forming peptide maturase SagD family component